MTVIIAIIVILELISLGWGIYELRHAPLLPDDEDPDESDEEDAPLKNL